MLHRYVRQQKSQPSKCVFLLLQASLLSLATKMPGKSSKSPIPTVQQIYKFSDIQALRTDLCDSYSIDYHLAIEMKSAVMTFSIEMDGETVASAVAKYE